MRSIISFVLILITLKILAQQEVKFAHLTTENGLSHNDVRTIFQDSKGFIWFGTLEGLNRFDGYEFNVYTHIRNDSTTLLDNTIDALDEDEDNNLWVVTNALGISKIHLPTNKITNYPLPSTPNDVHVKGNEVWVGLYGGIGRYNRKSKQFDVYPISIGQNNLNITSIINLKDNVLVLAADNSDPLIFFDVDLKTYSIYNYKRQTSSDGKECNGGKILLNDHEGNIWVGALGHGLYKIQLETDLVTFYATDVGPYRLSSNSIRSLCYSKRTSQIWIGTDGGGLIILNTGNNKGQTYQYEQYNAYGLSSVNGIYSICEDKTGIMWLGLYNGGINYYDQNSNNFHSYTHRPNNSNSVSNNAIMSLHEDRDGRIWVGTDGGGLNEFIIEKGIFKRMEAHADIKNTSVISSIEDGNENELLLGTWNNGMYSYNKKDHNWTYIPLKNSFENNIYNNSAWDIEQVKPGEYWIATIDGGLLYYNHNTGESIIRNDLINANAVQGYKVIDVRVLAVDSKKRLWVGTSGKGVTQVDLNNMESATLYPKNITNDLKSDDVRSILEDKRGNIWFGTHRDGICKWDKATNTFSFFTTADGLPDNTIYGIEEDDHGNLWLSGNMGITKYDPLTNQFLHFGKADGLPGNEFKYNATLKIKDGRLIFGSTNGLCVFHPDSIELRHTSFPVVFTSFYLFNKPVNVSDKNSPLTMDISYENKIQLHHWQSSFALGFTAINFAPADKKQYVYKLEGFDNNWNYINTSHQATYTNIPPGEYRFKVKASNREGIWNSSESSLLIIVYPPWWQTKVAYLFYAITLIGLLILFRHRAILKERRKNMYQLSLNKLRLLSNISHDLKTPLSLIRERVEDLLRHDSSKGISKRHDQYQMIYRQLQRMTRLSSQLMQMATEDNPQEFTYEIRQDIILFMKEIAESFSLHAKERSIRLYFEANVKSFHLTFNHSHLEYIIYNLLSNAFKFTENQGNIGIKISILNRDNQKLDLGEEPDASFIMISIVDDGMGIPAEKLDIIFERYHFGSSATDRLDKNSGLGLSIIKEFIEMNQGTIKVVSEIGKGSEFLVCLPIAEGVLGINKSDEIENTHVDYISTSNNESYDNSRPLILIVEDDIELRFQLMRDLSIHYRLMDAENGMEALKKLRKKAPDIIISDLDMPKMNGHELCKRIKNKVATSHIPIILFTGHVGQDIQLNSFTHGADSHLEKPINIEILKAQICNLLESRKQLREKFQNTLDIDPQYFTSNTVDEEFLRKLIKCIEENIGENANADLITKEMGISRSLLYSKLKELTGESVNSFISHIRINKSIQLLLSGHSVSETSNLVGFNSYSYFVRTFQKQMGKSPSGYIKDLKAKTKTFGDITNMHNPTS